MGKQSKRFHLSMPGAEIRIDDTETRPGVKEALMALVDRLNGRQAPVSANAPRPILPLTSREIDVARLIVEGLSSKEIRRRLVLSESTVNSHRRSLILKVGTSSKEGLAAYRAQWDPSRTD